MLNPHKFSSLKDFEKALFEDGIKQGWLTKDNLDKILSIGKQVVEKILKQEGR